MVVDDHEIVRSGLVALLTEDQEFQVPHAFASADECLRALQSGARTDLVVADLILGKGLDGIQLTKGIKVHDPRLPVLVLSGRDEVLAVPRDVFRDAHDLRGTNDIAAADVAVLHGDRPPTGPVHGSVLLVGDPTERHPDWARMRVDGWWIERADPTPEAIRRAWAEGLLRPPRTPLLEEWLVAARTIASADACAVVTASDADWSAGAEDVAETFGPGQRSALLASLRRHGIVALTSPAALEHVDWIASPLDAILAVPARRRGNDAAILLGVRTRGADWLPGALPTAHRLADSWMRRTAEARVEEVENQHKSLERMLRRVMSIVNHDLRNPLFAIQLGVKVVERQNGTSEAIAALHRSVRHAGSTLRRVVDATRAVMDTPTISSAGEGAAVGETVRRLVRQLELPADRWDMEQVDPSVRVELEQGTLDSMLEPLVLNAHLHGEADRPIVVSATRLDGTVTVEITNTGALPFSALDRLEPFEHRSGGGLGVGLVLCRRLAQVAGVGLELRQDGSLVRARLTMRAARGKVVGG